MREFGLVLFLDRLPLVFGNASAGSVLCNGGSQYHKGRLVRAALCRDGILGQINGLGCHAAVGDDLAAVFRAVTVPNRTAAASQKAEIAYSPLCRRGAWQSLRGGGAPTQQQ